MFHKILVAMDSSDISKNVFSEALSVAKATGASLMLLHVLSLEEQSLPDMPVVSSFNYYTGMNGAFLELYREQWQAFEQQGLSLLRSHQDEARKAGVPTEFSQNAGSPGKTICDVARSWHADLVVMGRRGLAGLSELLLGSVSNYVLHHAPCSVLTVQGQVADKTEVVQSNQVESVC